MLRSSKWNLSLQFPHQIPVCTSLLPNTCYMCHPSHSPWFDHPNNIWWEVQIIKFLIMQCFTLPCYLVPHRPKYLPSAPYNPHSVRDQVSHATDKIMVLYIQIFIFLDSKQEDWMAAGIPCVQSALNFCMNVIMIFILFIRCICWQSIYTPKNELNGIQLIMSIKTPTCCSTGVPTSGS